MVADIILALIMFKLAGWLGAQMVLRSVSKQRRLASRLIAEALR